MLLVQRVGLPMGRYLVRSGWVSCRRESGYFRLRYVPARCAVGFAATAIARRGYGPLLIGLAAAFALVIGKFFLYSNTLWIAGLALLIFASFWNEWRRGSKRTCAACALSESHESDLHQNLERG